MGRGNDQASVRRGCLHGLDASGTVGSAGSQSAATAPCTPLSPASSPSSSSPSCPTTTASPSSLTAISFAPLVLFSCFSYSESGSSPLLLVGLAFVFLCLVFTYAGLVKRAVEPYRVLVCLPPCTLNHSKAR